MVPGAAMLSESAVDWTVGVAVFASLIAVHSAFSAKANLKSRARTMIRSRSNLHTGATVKTQAPQRRKSVEALAGVLQQMKVLEGADARIATDLLARAGWRAPEALTIFFGFRLALPILIGVAAFILAPFLLHHLAAISKILVSLMGVAAGAFGPAVFVKNAGQTRAQKIQKQLPDALDLFVICAEAGLSLDAAVSRVAREIGRAAPELSDELGLTAIELGFLQDRREALLNLAKRVPLPSMHDLVTTLAQTERYGTPLAQSLRTLAAEFRDARLMKAEEKAARLPAILTVPMMLFILPPLFVVLIGPAVIQILASLPK